MQTKIAWGRCNSIIPMNMLASHRMRRRVQWPRKGLRPHHREVRMQIYQLFPAITDAPEWKSSAFKGPVLVRAESFSTGQGIARWVALG